VKPFTLDGHRVVWIGVRYLCPQRDMPDHRNAYGELVHTLGGVRPIRKFSGHGYTWHLMQ
jgi:hypothetical protein